MDARSEIDIVADAKLRAFSRMLIVDNRTLERLAAADLPPTDQRTALNENCKTWLDYLKYKESQRAAYKNQKDQYAVEAVEIQIIDIFSYAQAKVIDEMREQLTMFMSGSQTALTNSESPAAYALIAMQQACEGKVGGLDVARLAQAKQFLDDNGMSNLSDEFILPAVFLAGKNIATCATDFVKACEKTGNKMSQEDKKAFLQALDTHLHVVHDGANGTHGENRLACCEEGLKVLKALSKTATFAQPPKGAKSATQGTLFKGAASAFDEKLRDYKAGELAAKGEIKREKEAAKQEKEEVRRYGGKKL